VDALSYLLEAFRHLEVDFLNASRFPVRDRRAMSFKAQIREPGAIARYVDSVLPMGAAIRNPECGCFAGAVLKDMKLESDGMAFSEEIKIEALRHPPDPVWRDLDPVFLPPG